MGCVLLIGNGINRCVSDDISANELIVSLAKDVCRISDCKLDESDKSFSLLFESLLKKSNKEITESFDYIKKKLQILNDNSRKILSTF